MRKERKYDIEMEEYVPDEETLSDEMPDEESSDETLDKKPKFLRLLPIIGAAIAAVIIVFLFLNKTTQEPTKPDITTTELTTTALEPTTTSELTTTTFEATTTTPGLTTTTTPEAITTSPTTATSDTTSIKTGLQTIDGKTYYFDENGEKQNGWIDKYYAKDCELVNGLVEIDGNTYYFENFEKSLGWKQVDGNWRYFDSEGKMISNRKIKIGGVEYFIDANGVSDKAP